MSRMVEQVGLQEVGVKEDVVPVGRPEMKKETNSDVPEIRDAVTVLETEPPWETLLSPKLKSEKSKEEGKASPVKDI